MTHDTLILDLSLLSLNMSPDTFLSCVPTVDKKIGDGHILYLSNINKNMTETLQTKRNITDGEIFFTDTITNTNVFAFYESDSYSFVCTPERVMLVTTVRPTVGMRDKHGLMKHPSHYSYHLTDLT